MNLFFISLSTLALALVSPIFGWEPPKTAQEEMQDKWGGEIPTEIIQDAPQNTQEQEPSQTAPDSSNYTGRG